VPGTGRFGEVHRARAHLVRPTAAFGCGSAERRVPLDQAWFAAAGSVRGNDDSGGVGQVDPRARQGGRVVEEGAQWCVGHGIGAAENPASRGCLEGDGARYHRGVGYRGGDDVGDRRSSVHRGGQVRVPARHRHPEQARLTGRDRHHPALAVEQRACGESESGDLVVELGGRSRPGQAGVRDGPFAGLQVARIGGDEPRGQDALGDVSVGYGVTAANLRLVKGDGGAADHDQSKQDREGPPPPPNRRFIARPTPRTSRRHLVPLGGPGRRWGSSGTWNSYVVNRPLPGLLKPNRDNFVHSNVRGSPIRRW
jgi:hypothetical protein